MNENIFDKLDFGPLRSLLDNDDITDISFDNNGQIWVRSLTQGSLRVEVTGATPEFVEKLAFQCSNVMGTTFNNAKPFLDAESSELRLNFVHPSIATNGIAMVIRKTPAKIRLKKEKLIDEDYFTQDIHDVLVKCVEGHCNIIVAGETGSGKTEFVKYLASHTKSSEKIITIEDTLELHLDKIFPQRDIVAMKTNNVASYTDVLVTCMRQNPKWILLSEVRSAEAVSAVRNSISSGHNILSTIHADKASAIPYRLYSLMETDLDVNQFLSTIYRYIQLGVHIRAYYSKEKGKFHREVDEVVEFYVDENNQPQSRIIYQKQFGKDPILRKPSKHLIEYLENQNIDITEVTDNMVDDIPFREDPELDEEEYSEDEYNESSNDDTEYNEETEYEDNDNIEESYDENEAEENMAVEENDDDTSEADETAEEPEENSEEETNEEEISEEDSVEESETNDESIEDSEDGENSNTEPKDTADETEENNENEEIPEVNEVEENQIENEEPEVVKISDNIPLAGLTEEVQNALSTENSNINNTISTTEVPEQALVDNMIPNFNDNQNINMNPMVIPEAVNQNQQLPNMQQPINQNVTLTPQNIVEQPVMNLPPVQPQPISPQGLGTPMINQMPQQMMQQSMPQQTMIQQPIASQSMSQSFNPQHNNMIQSGVSPFMPPADGMPPLGSI